MFSLLSAILATVVIAAPRVVIQPRPHICPGDICHSEAQVAALKRGIAYSTGGYPDSPQFTSTATVVITVTVNATAFASSTASTSSPVLSSAVPPTITILSSTTTSTQPLPTSAIPEPGEELAGVYICEDVDWSGNCQHLLKPLGSSDAACTILDGTASSIGPDMGYSCLFFTNSFCREFASNGTDTLTLEYPGNSNLQLTANGNFNDRIHSYQCFRVSA